MFIHTHTQVSIKGNNTYRCSVDTESVRLGGLKMGGLQTDSVLKQDTKLQITLAVPVTCQSITNIMYTVDGLQHIYALSLVGVGLRGHSKLGWEKAVNIRETE